MAPSIVLFTRDLRVHDHPPLRAAVDAGRPVVALFVLDETLLASRYASPNRVALLLAALRELRASLGDRGADLWLRRGEVVAEVRAVAAATGADTVHLSADVSGYARRRLEGLRAAGGEDGFDVRTHPGVTLVEPGAVTPSGADHYQVFTPYWRAWRDQPHRQPDPAPDRIAAVPDPDPREVPARTDLVAGERSPELPEAGEVAALDRLDTWLDGPVDHYGEARDDLGTEGTSRLSHHLHLGTLSVAAAAARLDLRRRGHESFLRQLCWRDYNHQLLAANPDLVRRPYRPREPGWREDPDAFAAWRDGRTGYPLVDAGMRQLRREGHMHNRVRMIAASFLTKHLMIDWRLGAWHFMDWLADGDVANNFAQWQWAAGTGTDSRPNRMYNPVSQSRRHDPDGHYIRRYVVELREVPDQHLHTPWAAGAAHLDALGYPGPIVDHATARERFLDRV